MPPQANTETSQLSSRALLTSRLGRRLLGWFFLCALVPTGAVAILSFVRVTDQLTRQGHQRLMALAGAASKTLSDRLAFVESDLRRQSPDLIACARARPVPNNDCGDGLLYAAEAIAVLSPRGVRLLAGEASAIPSSSELTESADGQSVILAVRRESGAPRISVVHKVSPGVWVIAALSPEYLWSSADAEGLPAGMLLDVVDGELETIQSGAEDSLRLPREVGDSLSRNPAGSFNWIGAHRYLAGWAGLQEAPAFRLPAWRIIVSEARSGVIAPMDAFAHDFPVVLLLALLGISALSLRGIRRGLLPLAELRRGTLRIADGDFRTPVEVSGNDELADLGGSFNAMTARLDHQFRAMETAAEIDRAVLSSVDAGNVAQTVLERLPHLVPCHGVSLTVLTGESGHTGHTWVEQMPGIGKRSVFAASLTEGDIAAALEQPEWLLLGEEPRPVPEYLAHFSEDNPASLLCCPLRHGEELLGVLAVRDDPAHRTNESRLDLRRMADRIAVALSNARMLERVRLLAFYDGLTRLPNRVLYQERLRGAVARAKETGHRVAVCSLNLDHFGRINDTLGQTLGDHLLQEVAARLLACCRPEAENANAIDEASGVQLVRMGGDEFAVILPDLEEGSQALATAQQLLAVFQEPFRLGTQDVSVSASIGIAVFPDDATDHETVHKHAGTAMSHAKQQGRNTIELFAAALNTDALHRLLLEQELRRAVEQEEFTVWYQPIVDLSTREASGAEALVRWKHPQRGLVQPGEFIRLCEESGLIVPLGEWTLRAVCEQIRTWEQAGYRPPRISLNFSGRQLRERTIVRMVQDTLDRTGVKPGALTIELTESLLLEPGGTTERRIRELAELGLKLAIDDFGTGYSSLSYLKNFPISTLKIDRSFIVDLPGQGDAAAITNAIIAMAGAMNLDVVAEGVEQKAQAAFLRRRGCQRAQGYLFGNPVSAEDFCAARLSHAPPGPHWTVPARKADESRYRAPSAKAT